MAHLSRARVQLAPGPSFAGQALPGPVEYVQTDLYVSSVRKGEKPHIVSVRAHWPTPQASAYMVSLLYNAGDLPLQIALKSWLPRMGLTGAERSPYMAREQDIAERRHTALVEAIKGMPPVP